MSVARAKTGMGTGAGLTALLALAHAANDAYSNVLPAFLPTLQARFGLGEAALAGFVALVSISSNVLQASAGAVADRWGRRRAAAVGLLAASVLMSFLAVVPNVVALFLVLAVGGLGSALFHPAAASMARATGARSGMALGLFTAGGPLGTAAMPIVALFVLREYGAGYVPLLAVLGVALAGVLALRLPRQAKPEAARRPSLVDVALFRGPVGALAGAGILRAIAYISFLNAMPLYLANVQGYATDAPIIGWTLGCYGVASSLGVFAAGALERRLGRGRLIVGSMLAAFPLLLATLLLPPGGPAYYALVAAAGLASNAAIPLLVVSAQDLADGKVATASGMLMGFTWGVAGVIYVGFGALQQTVGLVPALATSFAFLVPAALLAAAVLRRHPSAARAG